MSRDKSVGARGPDPSPLPNIIFFQFS